MQVMANVMNMPIKIHKSEQTCALGAAMFAATVCGIYPTISEAMNAMGQGFDIHYNPQPIVVELYMKRYKKYKKFGELAEKLVDRHKVEKLELQ
jgi:L-ribulokinase